MLKKLDQASPDHPFQVGAKVYLVTRGGEIKRGFTIKDVLFDQVMLDKAPLEDTEKQGFTVCGDKLKPNWCAGRKAFKAGYIEDSLPQ